jgi:hypothetical protein
MFRIVHKSGGQGDARLEADAVLSPEDFAGIAKELGSPPRKARKIGFVAARRTSSPEAVETRWNGKESVDRARAGDWIVTNLNPQKEPLRDRDGHLNTYVILADRFMNLYEPAGTHGELGTIYRARNVVDVLSLPGGFDIVAPWGERQTAPAGYLIWSGPDVYGNNAQTFAATYELVPG